MINWLYLFLVHGYNEWLVSLVINLPIQSSIDKLFVYKTSGNVY